MSERFRDLLRDRLSDRISSKLGSSRSAAGASRDDIRSFTDDSSKPARLGPARTAKRAVLGPPTESNLLRPLFDTNGVQFPYTPDVIFGGSVEYNDFHFTHSNYPFHQYVKSMPQEIQVTGTFTAQTNDEGRYLVAAMRFFRSLSMLTFGAQAAARGEAGVLPPVLRFNYLGRYMFSDVPVVIASHSFTLPRDVDYVGIRMPGVLSSADGNLPGVEFDKTKPVAYVPTKMDISVNLRVQPNPRVVRQEFDLEKFKTGALYKKGFV